MPTAAQSKICTTTKLPAVTQNFHQTCSTPNRTITTASVSKKFCVTRGYATKFEKFPSVALRTYLERLKVTRSSRHEGLDSARIWSTVFFGDALVHTCYLNEQ